MAGMKGRSGGRRPNSGPKPKSDYERAVTGNPGHRSVVVGHPSSVGLPGVPEPIPVEEFDAPDELTMDERRVWMALAPHAFAARTLTKATALAFEMLCRNVVLEREMRASVLDRGRSAHQGLIAKLDAELLRFSLNPCGKPMYQAQPVVKPANPLEKYVQHG